MKKQLRAVIFFLARYKRIYMAVFGVSLIAAFLESLNVAAILPFMNILLKDSSGLETRTGYLAHAIDRLIGFIPFGDKLIATGIFLIAITLLKFLIKIINEALIAYASGTVFFDTKKEILKKYSNEPYRYFLENRHGTLMYYVLTAPYSVAKLLYIMSQSCADALQVLAIMAYLFTVNPYVTCFLIVLAVIFNGAIGFISRKVSYGLGQGQLRANTEQSNVLSEFIHGFKHIKIYNAMQRWGELFNLQSRKYTGFYIKNMIWTAVPSETMEVIAVTLLFGSLLALRLRDPAGILSYAPMIILFGLGILRILPSIRNIGKNIMVVWGMIPDAEMIYGLVGPNHKAPFSGTKEFIKFSRSIKFENVTFFYSNKGAEVLKDASLTLENGKTSAIIGASGSGKTTIINLLLGLFRPDSGRILVDDVSLAEYKTESWFNKIALVTQEPFIFHSTVADNISFGDGRYSQEEIEEAARIANAHDFIIQMPDGYKTIVGEKGMKLSGGQQQRIAIARAVIRKPQILIMDEATSALDGISEKAIQDAINNLAKMYTLIIVAHRLSTIKRADKIFVLKDGYIIEEGSHPQLMAIKGFYRQLYEHQFQ